MQYREGWIAELGGKKGSFFTRKHYLVCDASFYDKREAFIGECDHQDVYQCAYLYESKDIDSCRLISDPYLDFDAEDISSEKGWKQLVSEVKYVINYIETEMGISAEMLRIYFSGSKGFHVLIPHEAVGFEPYERLNEEFRLFALGIAWIHAGRSRARMKKEFVDTKIYDRKRLFRIVNTINAKSGLYKVPITVDQLYNFSYEDMKVWASQPREEGVYEPPGYSLKAAQGYTDIVEAGQEYEALRNGRRLNYQKKKIQLEEGERLKLLPCAQKLLEEGAVKGVRNHSCFALSSSLFQAGYTLEEVYELIAEWNERNEEQLAEAELDTTIASACSSYDSGMTVGCGKYRDLDLCVSTCKLLED